MCSWFSIFIFLFILLTNFSDFPVSAKLLNVGSQFIQQNNLHLTASQKMFAGTQYFLYFIMHVTIIIYVQAIYC